MATTIALDPRFPIPDSLSTRDPAHPLNLVRASMEIQNQAVADAEYDIPTPERFQRRPTKEAFGVATLFPATSPATSPATIIVLLVIVTVLAVAIMPRRTRFPTRILVTFLLCVLVFGGFGVFNRLRKANRV